MKLSFSYTGKCKPFSASIQQVENEGNPIIELRVDDGGRSTRGRTLINYLQTLNFALKGLSNTADSEIQSMTIEGLNYLHKVITKQGTVQFIDAKGEDREDLKFSISTYDIAAGQITEHSYLTKNGAKKSEDSDKNGLIYQGNMINPIIFSSETSEVTNLNPISIASVVQTYFPQYKFSWNKEQGVMELRTKSDMLINHNAISEKDVFTFFELLSVLYSKQKHIGVVFMNCVELSQDTVNAMLTILQLKFGNNKAVFLYNIPEGYKLVLQPAQVILPNYLEA